MCGGCGWNKGEYACTTWVADAVLQRPAAGGASEAELAAQLGGALRRSGLTVVELAMGGVDGADCARLAEALRAEPGSAAAAVRVLDLGWNAVGDGGAAALAGAMPHTALSSLDLRANGLTDACAEALAEAVAATPSLVELRLTGNKLSPASAERLAVAVAANCANALCLTCGELGHATGAPSCALAAAAATATPAVAAAGPAAPPPAAAGPARAAGVSGGVVGGFATFG